MSRDRLDDLGLDRDIAKYLYEFAKLRLAEGGTAKSVERLALLLQQPASQQARFGKRRIRDSAKGLLTELEAELSQEVYSAAMEPGQDVELEGMILELISSKN